MNNSSPPCRRTRTARPGHLAARLCAALLLGQSAHAAEGYPSTDTFAAQAHVGDLYSCLSADGEWALFAWIGAIDQVAGQPAYSVQITPVVHGLPRLGHAPFVAESFSRCLPDPTAADKLGLRFDTAAFETGYSLWKANKGGVFTIDILDIYQTMSPIVTEPEPNAAPAPPPAHEKTL